MKAEWIKELNGNHKLSFNGVVVAEIEYFQAGEFFIVSVCGCEIGDYCFISDAKESARRFIKRVQSIELEEK